jgi:hypothetical protein
LFQLVLLLFLLLFLPYHTQETGDSLTGAFRSLADTLAAAANSTSESDLQQLLQPSDHKRMFMSFGGAYMLAYSMKTAATLHNVPFVMALSAPAVLKLLAPSRVRLQAHRQFGSCVCIACCRHWRLYGAVVNTAAFQQMIGVPHPVN